MVQPGLYDLQYASTCVGMTSSLTGVTLYYILDHLASCDMPTVNTASQVIDSILQSTNQTLNCEDTCVECVPATAGAYLW